jgi:hypothetical protein
LLSIQQTGHAIQVLAFGDLAVSIQVERTEKILQLILIPTAPQQAIEKLIFRQVAVLVHIEHEELRGEFTSIPSVFRARLHGPTKLGIPNPRTPRLYNHN